MNSYPPDFLAQLAPVMFAAGLDVPPPPPTSPAQPDSPKVASTSQDPFVVLAHRLREALSSQRKPNIWQPDKNKTFHIVLADKGVKFPPRKTVPPEDPQYSAAHSPLSPLTSTSPIHPDGLIAPIWIRKHTTLVPSVFVLFLRIYEHPAHASRTPLDLPDLEREKEREREERKGDADLAAEVAARKKSTNERGIKLTVVLMASRRMLDDPTLDSRLTYIRRQSGLDSRAALFVLSPVSQAELGDFVRSLQQALYEPALEYYTAHSKRVRRKRNRHSQAVSSYPNPVSPLGTPIARPLRPEGWTVRYEYKMACFAEFRGEDEVALKHYQDAYSTLLIMFGSTVILPPRTKRWAEAKVLADCINIKVVKLYLYNNEHALALSHHNTHIRKFGDFSRGWGIGEDTYEFWSWIARQHRILAELLDQGTRSTLTIPVHKPITPPSMASSAALAQLQSSTRGGVMELDAMRTLGLNPSHALQHSGFYYYMAARCTEMRRDRFLAAVEAEAAQQAPSAMPGFMNEKKVDHLLIILELYTKSYELFKKYTPSTPNRQNQGRLTLWIACRIAQTYYDSGKFDMAVRFFERIAKTYRREQWGSMLRPLLTTWHVCAQRLGDVELSIKLLVEMIANNVVEGDDPSALQEDLLAVLKSTVPSSAEQTLVVDLFESHSILTPTVVFWAPEVKVGEPAAFQLSLTAPNETVISSLPLTSLSIHFSGDSGSVLVDHASDASQSPSAIVQRVDIGHVQSLGIGSSESLPLTKYTANLRWQPGATMIFSGTISSAVTATLNITKVVVTLKEGDWTIEMPFDPRDARQEWTGPPRWLSSLTPLRFVPITRDNSSSVRVQHRPHNVVMTISHQSPAYLGEDYPITVEVSNADDRELDVNMDVLLQPTEIDNAINSISVDGETSGGLVKGISFGTLTPGATAFKTLLLTTKGAAGDRMIDVSIQSRPKAAHVPLEDENEPDTKAETIPSQDVSEVLQTLVMPTVDPFKTSYSVAYCRKLAEHAGPADLRTFDSEYWDDRQGGEAQVVFSAECASPWGLDISSMVLTHQDNERAKITTSYSAGADDDNPFAGEYLPGDELSDKCRVSLAPSDDQDFTVDPIPGPGEYAIHWRRILPRDQRGPLSTSTFRLPSFRPPRDELIALLSVPPIAQLHRPTPLTLTIRNHHPTRSAAIVVQLEPDPSDSFVVAGPRSARLPILLPGAEERISWRILPIECGYVKIPRIRVVDRRKAIASAQGLGGANAEVETEGEAVRIVDVRLERRFEATAGNAAAEGGPSDSKPQEHDVLGTVLVLPS
ncbi:hypothetical protein HGRIS_002040 [Hohenbuehelia grisea]|uniref:Trafficking protein particle complex subunit 11 n=1 Tax=Hohenbuehelia grisea TaxID=104357 RepID=A0ABR3JKK7_9AGAR